MTTLAKSCVLVEPSSSMQQCMDAYGIEGEGPWVNNSISQYAQFWSCGMVSSPQSATVHDHDPVELKACRTLALAAKKVMGSTWALLRSGSDPETHPFFVASQLGAAVPSIIVESLIRKTLGGTLHPDASVIIEPLTEGTAWWQQIEEDAQNYDDPPDPAHVKQLANPWRKLIRWFADRELAGASFVRVSHASQGGLTLGCVFPCFAIGISAKGSVVGIMTHVVS